MIIINNNNQFRYALIINMHDVYLIGIIYNAITVITLRHSPNKSGNTVRCAFLSFVSIIMHTNSFLKYYYRLVAKPLSVSLSEPEPMF